MTLRARLDRALGALERAGDALPDPVAIFAVLGVVVLILSSMGEAFGWAAAHPKDGSRVVVVSLLDAEGVRGILTDAVSVFVAFPPLGVVLVTMLGVGLCERVGLVDTALRAFVRRVPEGWLTPAVVFAGVMSSVASDAGFVVLVPVGAAAFAAAGLHPVAGLTASFAGVSGGFSANLLVTGLDPLLGGITEAAARLVDPTASVAPTANWLFMAASTILVTAVGTAVTTRVVGPRLGAWTGRDAPAPPLDATTRAGLRDAALAASFAVASCVALAWPGGPLHDASRTGVAALDPLFKALIPLLATTFGLAGLAYGRRAGTLRSTRELGSHLGGTMAAMGPYVALAFVMAQVLSWFGKSNLGLVAAIRGAEALRASGLVGLPLLVGLVLLTATVNLLMASASAKWAILAPIFVPMLMLVGIAPATTQAAYRVGDSCTNMVTPLLPYLPLVLDQVRRHEPEAGLGRLLSLMVPYSLALLASWTAFFAVWVAAGVPLGVG